MESQKVRFTWPDTKPNDVIVTGSFDQWQRTIHLNKSSSGFAGIVDVPFDQKIHYKFIVDGKWMCCPTEPIDYDNQGNQNNYFYSGSKSTSVVPTPVATTAPQLPLANQSASEPRSDATGAVEDATQDVAPAEVVDGTPDVAINTDERSLKVEGETSLPVQTPTLERVAKTISATHGVTSPLHYVASGLGAAIEAVTGVDPINPPKIPIDDVDVTHEVHNEGLATDPIESQGASGPLVEELAQEGTKPSEVVPVVPVTEEPVIPAPSIQTTTTTEMSDVSESKFPIVPVVAPETTPQAAVVDPFAEDTPQISPEVVPEPVAVPPILSPVPELPSATATPAVDTEKTTPTDVPVPSHTTEASGTTTTTKVADPVTAPTTGAHTKAASVHGPETEHERKTPSPTSTSLRKSFTWSRKSRHNHTSSVESSPSKDSEKSDKDGTLHRKKRPSIIKKIKHMFD